MSISMQVALNCETFPRYPLLSRYKALTLSVPLHPYGLKPACIDLLSVSGGAHCSAANAGTQLALPRTSLPRLFEHLGTADKSQKAEG